MAGGKRGQLLPGVSLAAWAASSSSSPGVAGAVAALSPLLSHHGWAAAGVTGLRKSGAPRKAARLSVPPPPSPARLGRVCVTFPPFPLPSAGRKEGQSKPEMEAGKLLMVVGWGTHGSRGEQGLSEIPALLPFGAQPEQSTSGSSSMPRASGHPWCWASSHPSHPVALSPRCPDRWGLTVLNELTLSCFPAYPFTIALGHGAFHSLL